MRLVARRLQLNNGQWCALCSPEPSEAAQRIAFLRRVSAETSFMARSASDSPADAALAAEIIADQLEDDRALEIAAWPDDRMIACGSIGRIASAYPRKRHRAQLGVAVLREYWGLGLATAILRALIDAAPSMGYAQIELSVVSENARALNLYRRLGFREMGRIPDALRLDDGRPMDEILMFLKLENGYERKTEML